MNHASAPQAPLDLSILVSGLERQPDPDGFLNLVRLEADALPARSEIIRVATGESPFGAALKAAFESARGAFLITVDADISPPLACLADLWAHRNDAEVVIASRYVSKTPNGMGKLRAAASGLLNVAFRRGLSLSIHDLSSSFRIYRSNVVKAMPLQAQDYDVLEEVLVRACAAGWRVGEVPFSYAPNPRVRTRAHTTLALAYLRTFWSMWKLRNSIAAGDYDYRAHDSPIPLQKYWQRTRYRHIAELIDKQGPVLDVGCGSSHIIGVLPPGSVALDVQINKLRCARRFSVPLLCASGFALPFADNTFLCVLCSQVIEHVPMTPSMIDELCRVLKPGGRLVLGTPDYDRREWVYTEKLYGFFAPGGYADEHISHYTREGLLADFARRGFSHEATRYILRGELILAFRKPPAAATP